MRVDLHSHALINMNYLKKDLTKKGRKPPFLWNPLRNSIDLPRLEQGDVNAQSFTIYSVVNPLPRLLPSYFQQVKYQIRNYFGFLELAGDRLHHARNGAELKKLVEDGKRASFLSMEGAHHLDRNLSHIEYLKLEGVFYMTLTHFVPNSYVNPCHTSRFTNTGISRAGRDLMKKLKQFNILPDTAHMSDVAYRDFMKLWDGPLFCSHTGSRQMKPMERNVPDWFLKEMQNRDGLVGVIAFPPYLRKSLTVKTKTMAETAARFAEIAGPDKVAIGTDFDGYTYGPTDMKDVTGWPNLERSLRRTGFSKEEVLNITGRNALRFFEKYVH